ncbi:hypothetical protein LRR18_16910, partial [Mangrovimonas sp. AS39]|uniref:hypothetical protein n=1 Tax=Mangrovimonas futianensis TaxID=2895523 RepID=UPI001E5EC086
FQLARDSENKRVTDKTVNKEDKTVEHETWFTDVRYHVGDDLTCVSNMYYAKETGTIQFRYNQKLSPLNKHTAETEDLEDLQDELSAEDGLQVSSTSSKEWTWTIPMDFLKTTLPLAEQTAYTDLLARIKEEAKLHNR